MNPVHAAYYDAEFADALYSKVIRAIAGEKTTRWTIKAEQARNREVLDAFRAKLDADERMLQAFRQARVS